MDKKLFAGIAFVIGALIAGSAAFFAVRMSAEQELNAMRRERDAFLARAELAEGESAGAAARVKSAESKASKTDRSAGEIAAETERLANEKGDAQDRADKAESDLRKARLAAAELEREKNAEADKLKALLEKHGIFEHLTPEQIQARIQENEVKFRRAFEAKDKQSLLKAMADLQKLGPVAYDKAIELWLIAAADFGLGENWSKGPNTLNLNFQEYASLVSDFGLIKYALSSEKIDESFRISSLYGLPWWTSESAAERAKLAGDALLIAKGYTATAAIEALKDISDPSSVRYLSDYLSKNSDNPQARKEAVGVLAGRNTPEAWAAIEKTAASDSDESVRAAATQALLLKNSKATGVLITWVDPNGQGALAGIKVGDVMTSYNGRVIKTLNDINEAKKTVAAGESAPVKIARGETVIDLTLAPGQIGINGVAVTAK